MDGMADTYLHHGGPEDIAHVRGDGGMSTYMGFVELEPDGGFVSWQACVFGFFPCSLPAASIGRMIPSGCVQYTLGRGLVLACVHYASQLPLLKRSLEVCNLDGWGVGMCP